MTEHTPGPWDVEVEEPAQHVIRANWSSEQYPIARLLHSETRNAEGNARLIAAAPALLDVVTYFDYAYNWADDDGTLADDDIVELRVTGKALKDARAAIAQAKGEK